MASCLGNIQLTNQLVNFCFVLSVSNGDLVFAAQNQILIMQVEESFFSHLFNWKYFLL